MVGITQEKQFISFISIAAPYKSKILELLESKLILRVSKKWRPVYTEAIWKYQHKTLKH